ncbi:MHS family MFS transporter [Rhodococcus sp. HM1]|uniref:MFS transporter n=1 Tax=Rhodococcus sp. HM1 TaxID=2937759 RepID=UPI00200AD973|nr:MFS transporter [Rhodococcus sp. HM1]MCK8673124.1 MHS family MFS transporter [Rhodococcus sp. HM1]
MTTEVTQHVSLDREREYRRVLASSFLGSAIEYYDFLLYGTAASLVFGPLFFSNQGPAVALAASFATFAVGYLARPVGGIVFGQLGDRIGRKATLVTTMLMMGAASCAIGLLPTSAQIGAAAPILLVCLRIVQGLAVGGEWGGAALMALEHSPSNKRGFSASFANMGGPAGALIATLVFAAFSTLPREQFLDWGWRIPFLLSAALVLVGMFIRLKISESPLFVEAQRRSDTTRTKREVAIVTVFTRYRTPLLLASAAAVAALAFQTFMATFAISMATNTGVGATAVLLCKAGAALIHVFTIGYFAHLSDRLGRRRVLIYGAVVSIVLTLPLLMLLGSGSVALVFAGFVLGNSILQASMYGPLAAYVSEMFGTSSRYTGAGLAYQLGATVGGFTPFIAAALWSLGQNHIADTGWQQYSMVAVYLIGACLVTIVAVVFGKETKDRDLGDDTATA